MLSPDKGLLGTSQLSVKSECLSLFLFQAEVNFCGRLSCVFKRCGGALCKYGFFQQ